MKRQVRAWQADEDGQVLVMVAFFMVGLVAVVGLVADGGLVFSQRRDLQDVADAAAAAGAMQVDEDVYRTSGQVVLDEAAAREAAIQYLNDEYGLEYTVSTEPARLEVSVERHATTGFLRVVGIDGVDVRAHAEAAPRSDVGSP